MSAALSETFASGILPRRTIGLPAFARPLRRLLGKLARSDGYRPERHYMRGGTTPGCRSQAAAAKSHR
jgi:hypothetical protein